VAGGRGMLIEAARLEAINVGVKGGEADVLEDKFLGASAYLTAGAWVGKLMGKLKRWQMLRGAPGHW
jgi:hypothetical protein